MGSGGWAGGGDNPPLNPHLESATKIHRSQRIHLPDPESSQITEINHFQFGFDYCERIEKTSLSSHPSTGCFFFHLK